MTTSLEVERLPPHDIEAEEAVLGSLLIDDEAIFKVSSFLEPEDFFREKNRWIYEACIALSNRNEPINQVSVAYELSNAQRLEPSGGNAYLFGLMAMMPTSTFVDHYGLIVKRRSIQRKLLFAAGRIAGLAQDAGPDVDSLITQAEEMIYSLRGQGAVRDFTPVRDVMDAIYADQNAPPADLRGRPEFIPTGFPDLDVILGGGLKRSDLVILAARPSVGKTSFALNIATQAALKGFSGNKARVAIFSLEMSNKQLGIRMLSAESNVDQQRIERQTYSDTEYERMMNAMGHLFDAEIYIDDSATIRISEIRSKLRRLDAQKPVDLVIVDYLQLIQGSATGNNANRVNEVSEITRGLKALARESNVPVVALSQLSRAIEQRPNHEPLLSDLRESGSIEQDADIVMFLAREDKRYTEEEWKQATFKGPKEGQPYPRGIVDVIIAKHRNGPTGRTQLRFFDNSTKFGSLERRRDPSA